jgi:hypothetical protein
MPSKGGNSNGVAQLSKNGLLSVIVGHQLPPRPRGKRDQEQLIEISRLRRFQNSGNRGRSGGDCGGVSSGAATRFGTVK